MNLVSIALSGLLAGRTRVETAAGNIVNSRSTGSAETVYRPRQTVTTPAADNGGVITRNEPRQPGLTTLFAPDDPAASSDGFVFAPDVFLPAELVEMQIGAAQYRVSLKLLETADRLDTALLEATDRRV